MKFLFGVIPAFGHALPMFSVAEVLLHKGHEVHIWSGISLEKEARKRGLIFHCWKSTKIQNAFDMFELSGNGEQISEEWEVMLRIISLLFSTFDEALSLLHTLQPDCCFVDSATYALAAACNLEDIPWATSTVFPSLIPTDDSPMFSSHSRKPPISQKEVKQQGIENTSIRRNLAKLFDKPINEFLEQYDIKAASPAVIHANLSKQLIILFSFPWLENSRKDWPENIQFVGPDLWSIGKNATHLIREKPIIYVTLGTFWQSQNLYLLETIMNGLIPLGFPLVVTTGGAPLPQLQLLDAKNGVHFFDFVSHESLLNNCVLVVHHGGFGTTMGSIITAAPSLIIPLDFAQNEMAWKCKHKILCDVLEPNNLNSQLITEKARSVINNSEIHTNLKYFSNKIKAEENASIKAANILEKFSLNGKAIN